MKELENNPKVGSYLINNCYKIRLANSSIPVGKKGGFRVITYYIDGYQNIYLIGIYSKTDLETMKNEKINELLKGIKA